MVQVFECGALYISFQMKSEKSVCTLCLRVSVVNIRWIPLTTETQRHRDDNLQPNI